MMFAQRQNRLTTHFSERVPVVKRHICVFLRHNTVLYGMWTVKVVEEHLPYRDRHFWKKLWCPRRILTAS